MEKKSSKELIISTLKEKSCMKQDVYERTTKVFESLKNVLQELVEEFRQEMDGVDKRVELGYKSKGTNEAEFRFAGDALVFHMHTNVFCFDKSHSIWKTSYVKENELRGYCGMINIYNFLADSLKYNRMNDSGYLVARIFVNMDNHFFVEGKQELGHLYNDFMHSVLDKEALRAVIDSAILYSLDFDLLTPPYENMKEITVFESQELTSNVALKTGKRLGFKFEADRNTVK